MIRHLRRNSGKEKKHEYSLCGWSWTGSRRTDDGQSGEDTGGVSCDPGYTVYIDPVREQYPEKKFLSTPMKQEVKRRQMAFEEAVKGQDVAMVCSGDAGVYGMAGLIYEVGREYPEIKIEIIPGITAATGGAAVLGAPLMHDFAVISLSDLLTPWEQIEERPEAAAKSRICDLSL